MKSFRISLKNVATIVACFAVSTMLFTGCEKDDPTPEPDNGIAEIGKTYVSTTANAEKVYTLKVSKNLLKSTATATDTYVLLYVDKSGEVKTSTGVVTSSVGESLTLTPTGGTPFTVTVTANGITGISGSITFTDNSTATGGSLMPFANGEIEITGTAITEDRVLGVPGMAINYVYNGTNLLEVNGGKTLVVLPGTTIRFSKTDGGILITDGATVKMLGEDKLRELDAAGKLSATPSEKSGHITLKGGSQKGSWARLHIETNKENILQYVDLLNGGSRANEGGVLATNYDAKISMTNCKISGSLGHGIYLYNEPARFTAFSNNVIENCNAQPAYVRNLYNIPFDNTSIFTNNSENYIFVLDGSVDEQNLIVNSATVPYYLHFGGIITKNLTVNKGVTFYIGEDRIIDVTGTAEEDNGKIIVNGGTGADEKVTFTRLPNKNYYWQGFLFMDTGDNVIKNCLIEYGGNPNNDANINAYYRSAILLENVAINNSAKYGIKLVNDGTGIIGGTNVTFSGNAGGAVLLPDETVVNAMP